MDFIVGLDLGQTQDFTALAVLERSAAGYAVRHMQRFPLGTAYTAIVPSVARLCNAKPLAGHCTLVVDQTGVGRPVVELLQRQPGMPRIVPVTITFGHRVSCCHGGLHVPKKLLVGSLLRLLRDRRLRIATGIPQAQALIRELENFRVKLTHATNETFAAAHEGDHDDLVLAVALACWWAERQPKRGADAVSTGGESTMDQAPPGVFRI